MDFIAHLRRQRAFSARIFGPGARTTGVLDHIRKELREIEAKPDDLSEWIDVVLLACDGAWRAGYTPEQIAEALAAKLARNEAREWPDWRTADPDKAIEHVKAAPTAPSTTARDMARQYLAIARAYAGHIAVERHGPNGEEPCTVADLIDAALAAQEGTSNG